MRDGDDTNILLAFYQALNRVYSRLSPEMCEALLETIDKRPDSLEKFHHFQAVELLTRRLYHELLQGYGQEIACEASYWATEAQLRGKGVWRRLYGNPAIHGSSRIPPVNDYPVLVDLVDDRELMGLLGLEAGWTPDLKQIDPKLDLPSADKGMNL